MFNIFWGITKLCIKYYCCPSVFNELSNTIQLVFLHKKRLLKLCQFWAGSVRSYFLKISCFLSKSIPHKTPFLLNQFVTVVFNSCYSNKRKLQFCWGLFSTCNCCVFGCLWMGMFVLHSYHMAHIGLLVLFIHVAWCFSQFQFTDCFSLVQPSCAQENCSWKSLHVDKCDPKL